MNLINAAIPNLTALLHAIDAECTNRDSYIHGPAHWRAVAAAGLRLLTGTQDTDPAVVLLFAMFHDSMRLNDGHDPQHGPRAAVFAQSLHGKQFHLGDEQLSWLLSAIHDHTDGRLAANPTIACCWDADRLNLWRIGCRPDPTYLSTEAARMQSTIQWARTLPSQSLSWMQLVLDYRAEASRRAAPTPQSPKE